jgi:hypothetical protein
MKELPDDQILLEILEDLKLAEQAAREMCQLSTEIALKYQQRIQRVRESQQQKLSPIQSE